MRIVILAQGQQSRMPDLRGSKHHIPIAGTETIIERTLRLLAQMTPAVIVVVAPATDVWRAICLKHSVALRTHAWPGDSVLDGIQQCSEFLRIERHVYLLGDVVFSRDALRNAVAMGGPTHFFGRQGENVTTGKRHGELFALQVDPLKADPVLAAVSDAAWRKSIRRPGSPGQLWDLQRRLGAPIEDVGADWSDDLDTPADLLKVLPRLRVLVADDDKKLP